LATLALVPSALSATPARCAAHGDGILVEVHLPSSHPGFALRICIHGTAPELLRLQRHLNRTVNHRHSRQVLAGMLLLLAVCGFVVGGLDGARGAVADGTLQLADFEVSPP
jgi:hypothetical protein